jgi:cell division protein FtsI/penicillin-binding protein 2
VRERYRCNFMRTLDSFFGDARGTAVLLDLRTRKAIAAHEPELARRWLLPPGSTVKPFSVMALLESRKLRPGEQFPCPIYLTLARRSFACSHQPLGVPMRAETAIAYSCNNFVAHFAKRFEAGELARVLTRARFATEGGRVQPAGDVVDRQLQAIGEARVLVTPIGLLAAYSELASQASGPILEGLEGAVEYGTAQLAGVRGVKVAGKTGTVMTSPGAHVVWFVGFAPSRAPEVAIVVAAQGRSGAMDAAPIAGRILSARFEGAI